MKKKSLPGSTSNNKMVVCKFGATTWKLFIRKKIEGKISSSLENPDSREGCPRGVMVKAMDFGIGKGVAPSPKHWCSSYLKGNLQVTLDYSRQQQRLV